MVVPTFEPGPDRGSSADVAFQGLQQGTSWMGQLQQRKMQQQQMAMQSQQMEKTDLQLALERMQIPLKEATSRADIEKAKTAYDGALHTQELRSHAYALKNQADRDFDTLNLITDDKARAAASREWLSRYAQLANIAELKDEISVKNHLATSNVMDSMKLNMLTGADYRSFQALTKDMSPEDQEKARRVKAGIEARPSSAAILYRKVLGPDGSEQLVAVDPRAVGAQVVGSGQTFGSGVSPTKESDAAAEGQVVPASENAFKSQSTQEKARATEAGKKDAEYAAQLKMQKPKRTASLRQAEILSERMSDDIDELIKKVGTSTAGPGGVILEKFPGTSARDLASNLDSIKANIGFQTLQAMREASPTGGALGQVSDVEGRQLQAALGSLQIGQSPAQLIANLKKVKQRMIQNFGVVRSAYDSEYGGGSGDSPESSHPAGWDDAKEQRLMELKAKLGK